MKLSPDTYYLLNNGCKMHTLANAINMSEDTLFPSEILETGTKGWWNSHGETFDGWSWCVERECSAAEIRQIAKERKESVVPIGFDLAGNECTLHIGHAAIGPYSKELFGKVADMIKFEMQDNDLTNSEKK